MTVPGNPDYALWPGHPLYAVPAEVLAAARKVLDDAAAAGDLDDPEDAHPLADAVIAEALPALWRWMTDGGGHVWQRDAWDRERRR